MAIVAGALATWIFDVIRGAYPTNAPRYARTGGSAHQPLPVLRVRQAAVLDEDQAVRDLAQDVDVVRLVRVQGHEHQPPLGAQPAEEREHEADVAVVDVELRLVEEVDERVVATRAASKALGTRRRKRRTW